MLCTDNSSSKTHNCMISGLRHYGFTLGSRVTKPVESQRCPLTMPHVDRHSLNLSRHTQQVSTLVSLSRLHAAAGCPDLLSTLASLACVEGSLLRGSLKSLVERCASETLPLPPGGLSAALRLKTRYSPSCLPHLLPQVLSTGGCTSWLISGGRRSQRRMGTVLPHEGV